ncbi:hypothetical protein RND71_041044 [Anisodus tanguticus]|uniref:Uncharacterized protein n=1 Tax=Anisodus tanguticus TaxID=243964 RepID=A0AAE1QWL1_9SOLA|nr:hypothetical protein RND71_041044 [Anisodus tanguticus]
MTLFNQFSKCIRDGMLSGHNANDCEMYVAVVAEYLSLRECILNEDFNDELLHAIYGALLWDYSKEKSESEVVSDDETPSKPIRSIIDFDQLERPEYCDLELAQSRHAGAGQHHFMYDLTYFLEDKYRPFGS